ncbi:unnamed protein product, partial [Brenthis ino]
MPPPRFNFPPESYSAVYTSDVTSANAVNCKLTRGEAENIVSPASSVNTSPVSIFGCFQCAFSNNIKAIRKQKHSRKTEVSF